MAAVGSSGMGIMSDVEDFIWLAFAQLTMILGVGVVVLSSGQSGVTNVPVAAVSRVK